MEVSARCEWMGGVEEGDDKRGVKWRVMRGVIEGHDLELCAVEVVGAASKLLVVDALVNIHLAGVDLQNARTCLLGRVGEFNLAIEAP
jgi:hypothetical protein